MPKGLKQSSSVVPIGFSVRETVAGTMEQAQIDLNLSPLDREVFVVLAINLDPFFPDAVAGANTQVNGALTSTSQTAMPSLADANCLAKATNYIAGGIADGVGFAHAALETPPSTLDYIGIIATNDFFIQVEGLNNLGTKGMAGKLYGLSLIHI